MGDPWSSCTVTDEGSDPIAAEPAVIDLGFVGHATVLLDVAGTRILTDPFLRSRLGPLERHGPLPDPDARRKKILLSGDVPSPIDPPSGCSFHPRCFARKGICTQEQPLLQEIGGGHQVACHL